MKASEVSLGDVIDDWEVTLILEAQVLPVSMGVPNAILLTMRCEHWNPTDLEADGALFWVTKR